MAKGSKPRKWPARSRSVWSAPHSGAFFFRGNSSGLAWAVTILLAARRYLLQHLENVVRDREAFGVRRIPALSFSDEIHYHASSSSSVPLAAPRCNEESRRQRNQDILLRRSVSPEGLSPTSCPPPPPNCA